VRALYHGLILCDRAAIVRRPNNEVDGFYDVVTFKQPWQMQALNCPLSASGCQFMYVAVPENQTGVYDTMRKIVRAKREFFCDPRFSAVLSAARV
jgi:hypothetical protein